ncbi:hypothetical protein [Ureaplasma ceti]|uniref:Uncharacterized protein n=1 Tax=Ureaplasma ceti TaxID=3119530 RepID=A0ABP9U9F0_9BACT
MNKQTKKCCNNRLNSFYFEWIPSEFCEYKSLPIDEEDFDLKPYPSNK